MTSSDGHAELRGVADLLTRAAATSPDKLAVVEAGGRSLTWAQLDDEVDRVATGLGSAGVVAGHRVLLALGNRIEFVTTYLGILRAQAVAVPVNPQADPTSVARMIGDSGSRIVVTDDRAVATVRQAVGFVERAFAGELDLGRVDAELLRRAVLPRVYVAGGTLEPGEVSYDALRASSVRAVPELLDPERLAALLYTSGASGRPRAAMLTHRALLANLEQIAAVEPPMLHGDDVVLGALPLFHVYGLNAVLGAAMWHRAKLLLVERFEPTGTLDLIDDEAISVVPVAPPVIADWLGQDHLSERLGPVRLVLSGSAPLDAEAVDAFTDRTGIAVHQGYGLTEAAPVVTNTLIARDVPPGSVGRPLPGIELRLIDDHGQPVEDGDPGEICLRGANLFSGYWPGGTGGPDSDGWWSTGDVAIADEAGNLFLVDRLGEVVAVSGFHVYPAEVEDAISEVPGVHEVAVIGVPDEHTGAAVVAYVVPADAAADRAADGAGDTADHHRALRDAVVAHCESRLAGFKRPARVEVVAQLPHTVTGKVQKGRLRTIERRRALGLLG